MLNNKVEKHRIVGVFLVKVVKILAFVLLLLNN